MQDTQSLTVYRGLCWDFGWMTRVSDFAGANYANWPAASGRLANAQWNNQRTRIPPSSSATMQAAMHYDVWPTFCIIVSRYELQSSRPQPQGNDQRHPSKNEHDTLIALRIGCNTTAQRVSTAHTPRRWHSRNSRPRRWPAWPSSACGNTVHWQLPSWRRPPAHCQPTTLPLCRVWPALLNR